MKSTTTSQDSSFSSSSTLTSSNYYYYNASCHFLRGIIYTVSIYGIGMIWFGKSFAIPLFDLLQFGPNTATVVAGGWTATASTTSSKSTITSDNDDGDTTFLIEYCVFMFGVIGSILIGWMVLLYNIIQHFMRMKTTSSNATPELRAMARKSIFYSVVSWFVFDTSFSITIRQYGHAIFNIPFLLLLVVPLVIMGQCDDPKTTEEEEAAGAAATEATNARTKKTS